MIPLSGVPIIERKDIRKLLGQQKIPTNIQKTFLEELESFGWIKFHNRRKIEVDKEKSFSFYDGEEDLRNVEIL